MKNWIPLLLLIFIWFFPGQTAPGGLLENYIIVRWLTYLIIPVLFVYCLLGRLFIARKWDITPIMGPIIFIAFFSILSGLVNQKGIFDIASSLGLYLRYPLLFLVLVNMRIDERTIKRTIYLFLTLLFLQLPEVITRYVVWGIRHDSLSFTLGPHGTLPLGIYCLYSGCIIMAHAIVYKIRFFHLLAIGLLLIPVGIGEIKALFFFFPVVILVILAYSIKNHILIWRKIFLRGFFIMIIILLSLGFIFSKWEKLSGTSSLYAIIDLFRFGGQSFDPLKVGRISELYHSLSIISSSTKSMFLGLGPGSSLVGTFTGNPSIYVQELYFRVGYPISIAQLPAILGDLGMIGLLLHIWMFIVILKYTLRFLKTSEEKFHKMLCLAFIGIWIFYVFLGPLYYVVWRYDGSSYIFWFIAVAIYRFAKIRPNEFRSNISRASSKSLLSTF